MSDHSNDPRSMTVSTAYVVGQLARALRTSTQHTDVETRERAETKAERWSQVLDGMLSGFLQIGSRTPIAAAPVWATPQVLTGGFATGSLFAAGALEAHENARYQQLDAPQDVAPRAALNGSYLTEAGLEELKARLDDGCYEIAIPEEGALLVVAWLLGNASEEEARALLDLLIPYVSSMRFYPRPASTPIILSEKLLLQTVGELIAKLRTVKASEQVLAQSEAIKVWAPLYDRMVALFLEQFPSPSFGNTSASDASTKITNNDWKKRAAALSSECQEMRTLHTRCKKPWKRKGSFHQLHSLLLKASEVDGELSAGEASRVRTLLARYIEKRGAPGSQRHQEARGKQQQQVANPTYDRIAGALTERFSAFPPHGGIEAVEVCNQPLNAGDTTAPELYGAEIPFCLERKIKRSLYASAELLVREKVITSGDTLAALAPQLTGTIQAGAFPDEVLQRLYAALYRAFRKRRSLLLLNLESQVKLSELPWVAVLERYRKPEISQRQAAKECLERLSAITLKSFPYAIVPNKMLQELRGLARDAAVELPLVDELAADIFMGQFTRKFLDAAKAAGKLLSGTVYERYYGIDYRQVLELPAPEEDERVSPAFAALCKERVNAAPASGNWVAANGMIIEQQQILTTQNLASLFAATNLRAELASSLPEMIQVCFRFICRRQQMKVSDHHAKLIARKNCAYAWRQLIFFLSMLPEDEQDSVVVLCQNALRQQSAEFQQRFSPILAGLVDARTKQLRGTPFLGWG